MPVDDVMVNELRSRGVVVEFETSSDLTHDRVARCVLRKRAGFVYSKYPLAKYPGVVP
jgi:hypothetical protein